MRTKAKWLGREATMRKLNRLLPKTEEEVAAAQLLAAKELADSIRVRAPARTGAYRNSIQGDRLSARPGKQSMGGLKGQTTDRNATGIFAEFIWRWLEFGFNHVSGKHVPARPHILPTYRASKKAIRRKVAKAVNTAVRKVKRG